MSALSASRKIPAIPPEVFAAFSDPARLARWWGPAGFTSAFTACEFKPGGQWSFIMHGPDGTNYRNECVFEEIEAPGRLVIRHVSEPRFSLTITLVPSEGGTLLTWLQEFENPELPRRLERILRPANEQNLDRLTAVVLRQSAGDPSREPTGA